MRGHVRQGEGEPLTELDDLIVADDQGRRDADGLVVRGIDDQAVLLRGRDDGLGDRMCQGNADQQALAARTRHERGSERRDARAQLRTALRCVLDESGALATLDVGHLLGYQWLRGRRGAALYDELERLPLDATFEIHLSRCAIENDRFIDFHHGVLLDEQLELLSRLLDMCGHVRAVTYEDPRFDDAGRLLPQAIPNVERLAALIEER